MIDLGNYDVIVIGAGHAGCEAALASARMGLKTLILTMNPDTVAQMSCNPAIGGLAKGHIVKEIDCLGGEMGRLTDKSGIQFRMLNKGKGPAVWAPRAQADKKLYQFTMKETLEKQENLDLVQGEVNQILTENKAVTGVTTSINTRYGAKAVIVTTGTFLNGLIHIGEYSFGGGRAGDKPSHGISKCLIDLGLEVLRLKTGTPCRLNGRSIDFKRVEIQPGDEEPEPFSFRTSKISQAQLPCYLTWTNETTHRIIQDNLHKSPLYTGKIQSRGPRYCPSIEDKVVKFHDKPKHQVFLEPEGRHTTEFYVNGLSTSLPQDVQIKLIQSIQGLENAELMRFGYAVEYDFVQPTQIKHTLETKTTGNLYLAGQINGTSGYEEAACQGFMAGVNAALKILGKEPLILGREEAYIGVLIDDLVTKGTLEPYRMFTSRAEYRLLLRQDNTDTRLFHHGNRLGLINASEYSTFAQHQALLQSIRQKIQRMPYQGIPIYQYLKMPESNWNLLHELFQSEGLTPKLAQKLAIEIKYEGYIDRESRRIEKSKHYEAKPIPLNFCFDNLQGLSREAQEKLLKIKPISVGQASRISGISPSDISILLVHIEKHLYAQRS